MNNESLFYLYIVGEYEYTEIMYSNKNKPLTLKIGDSLFNIINNREIVLHILNEYTERFLDLNIRILDYDSCSNLLNNLITDLEKNNINTFLSNLIYHDLIIICKKNIELLNEMHKDLLKEKTNLFIYNKLIKNKDENAINNYITKNKCNYKDEKEYKKLLSSNIETKICELEQELKFCKNNIKYFESELDPVTFIAKSNINIHKYIDTIKNKLEIFCLFFSKKYNKQKQNVKNVFKKVLSSEIKIPSCIINYAIIEENVLKKINIKNITRNDLDSFLQYKPYIVYNISCISDLFNVYLKYFIDNNSNILICKNCGKFFIPQGKQIYCNNIYHNNKSCKQLSGDMKKNNDKIYVLYRSNYKTQFNKMNRNKNNITNIKDKFDKWNKLAKVKAQECRNGIISFDDLKIWFKTNQDWHKK